MEPRTLEALFMDKYFTIPEYQRDYAWKQENVEELFDDIREALEDKASHYVGTFILSRKPGNSQYRVVDGQQRITTLTMLIHVLILHLSGDDSKRAVIYTDKFIESNGSTKLHLAGENDNFFRQLLEGVNVVPTTRGQRLLKEAYECIVQQVFTLKAQGKDVLARWLDCVRALQVLEFVETEEGRAIRIFETVNDRGVALTNMDKVKSLLVYHSNRYVDGRLDETINQSFGRVFRSYDAVRDIAEDHRYDINLLKQQRFSEDWILRWHFLAAQNDEYDYNATEAHVLDALRRKLRLERGDMVVLFSFLDGYVQDLARFFDALHSLLRRAVHEPRYYKLFCMLGPSTWLYPLLIRLEMLGLLDEEVPGSSHLTFADLIEIADIRIYKARGTDPRKEICLMARDTMELTPEGISKRLLDFVKHFMDDTEFMRRLRGDVYNATLAGALPFILISWDEHLLAQQGNPLYTHKALMNFHLSEPTIEHVFAEEPTFDFPSRGFALNDDYVEKNHKLGNLLLLEKAINSRCQNKTVEEKIEDLNLYSQSDFAGVQHFRATRLANGGQIFSGKDIEERTEELAKFCVERWPLWS